MTATAKDWEDRVVLLEKEKAELKAGLDAHAKELAEARGQVTALQGGLEQARAAEKARRAREVDDYLAGLKAKALPNAIAEQDLAKVKALFDRNDDENARFVGGLLLKGATAGTKEGAILPLAPQGDTEKKKADTAYVAGQLRAAGWTVQLSADGTEITSKTPPKRGK